MSSLTVVTDGAGNQFVDAESTNVVDFPAQVWEHKCGSQRYILRRGGIVECAWCGQIVPDKTWGDK